MVMLRAAKIPRRTGVIGHDQNIALDRQADRLDLYILAITVDIVGEFHRYCILSIRLDGTDWPAPFRKVQLACFNKEEASSLSTFFAIVPSFPRNAAELCFTFVTTDHAFRHAGRIQSSGGRCH